MATVLQVAYLYWIVTKIEENFRFRLHTNIIEPSNGLRIGLNGKLVINSREPHVAKADIFYQVHHLHWTFWIVPAIF